jgi:hypothetical protein
MPKLFVLGVIIFLCFFFFELFLLFMVEEPLQATAQFQNLNRTNKAKGKEFSSLVASRR